MNEFDDDDSSDPESQDLAYSNDETLTGTDGDDTLLPQDGDEDLTISSVTVNLLGGDDLAETLSGTAAVINGGDGNDTLTSTGFQNDLYGDDGDDSLTGVTSDGLYGGAGDDRLTLDQTFSLNDRGSYVSGGDGDDIIDVTTEVGLYDLNVGGLSVEGGAGADDFLLTLELADSLITDPGGPSNGDPEIADSGVVVNMSDFTPGEDALTIEIARGFGTGFLSPGFDYREMSDVELVPFDGGTDLIMTFEASDDALEATATIRFTGDQEIALDDIVILQH